MNTDARWWQLLDATVPARGAGTDEHAQAVTNLMPGSHERGSCESLLYAAAEAHEAKTDGEELPWDDSVARKTEPDGERWDERRVHELCPELAKRFNWK